MQELEAWAKSPAVLGQAHSRLPRRSEPLVASSVRELQSGAAAPPGWAFYTLSVNGKKDIVANQDAFSFTSLASGWAVWAACDGHGDHGHVVSQRLTRTFPLLFSRCFAKSKDPVEALRLSFLEAQADLEAACSRQQEHSGSTMTAICLSFSGAEIEHAWVAHTGDSQLAVGDLTDGRIAFLTGEHKPHEEIELRRLTAAGAQVSQKEYDDGEKKSNIFVPGSDWPGLAMARSFGDGCLKSLGVIADPEVFDLADHLRQCELPIMLLASDGLWNAMPPPEAVETLTAHLRESRASGSVCLHALCRDAQDRWLQSDDSYCDDVTMLLLGPQESFSRVQDEE